MSEIGGNYFIHTIVNQLNGGLKLFNLVSSHEIEPNLSALQTLTWFKLLNVCSIAFFVYS